MDNKIINHSLAYLGKKIDDLKTAVLSKNVNVDIGESLSVVSKNTVMPLQSAIGLLIKAVEQQTALLGKKDNMEVVDGLRRLRYELSQKSFNANVKVPPLDVSPLNAVLNKILSAIEKNKASDNKEVLSALGDVKKAILGLKFEVEKPDLSGTEKTLGAILEAVKENKAADYTESFDAFGKAILEVKPKDEVTINSKQLEGLMAAIMNSGGGKEAPNGGLYSGRQVVTSAGTPVQLSATSERCESITIVAESDNTGLIAVGDASVVAAEGSQQGAVLTPLGSLTVKVGDLSKLYIDATVSGDGVSFSYER